MKPGTDIAELIQVVAGCAFCRPAGRVTLTEACDMVERAIVFARERQIPQLIFNGTQLAGFPSPSLPERYFFARRFAAAARGQVQMALVIRSEMIDPEKFGAQVARNAGMNTDVFDSEPPALAWLLFKPPASKSQPDTDATARSS